MIDLKRIFFFLFIFISTVTYSQEIYVCESHTENGEPIGADIEWEIKPWGSYVYLLYRQSEPIEGSLVYLLIDKLDNDRYQPFESRAIHLEGKVKWVAQNYKFTQPGEYEVYFMSSNEERLATEIITVTVNENFRNALNLSNFYYDNTQLTFCQRVIEGKAYNIKKVLSMSRDAGKVYLYLKNSQPLNTGIIMVNVWRKSDNDFDYGEFVYSKKFKMDKSWPDVFFRLNFPSSGEYQISIYNEEEELIRYGFLKVVE